MIYIYGDSHANYNYNNLQINNNEVRNLFEPSITMYRIGRDGIIINYNKEITYNENDLFILCYGEVDCRCHIKRQIDNGLNEDDIIKELIDKYFTTIIQNINKKHKIIITAIIPPVPREQYEELHGPILHEFPFVGTNEERLRFTEKMNQSLETKCEELNKLLDYSFYFFNPYGKYKLSNGLLDFSLSDKIVHIGDNNYIIKEFEELYKKIINTI